jgi:hypothetical protein
VAVCRRVGRSWMDLDSPWCFRNAYAGQISQNAGKPNRFLPNPDQSAGGQSRY